VAVADFTATRAPTGRSPNFRSNDVSVLLNSRATCAGRAATIVGSPRADRLVGTRRSDVIVGTSGNDRIRANGGNDLICAAPGNDCAAGGS
jgi:RTX calcium-binding nonapeptide repeat (4 copies)